MGKRITKAQIRNSSQAIPEFADLRRTMQNETANMWDDYIRQWVGAVNINNPQPGQGIFINFDRVGQFERWKELWWYDMYAEVQRDPHVSAVLSSAKLNVAGMKWDIVPFIPKTVKRPKRGKAKTDPRNQEIADFVKNALKDIGFLPQHLYDLMDALGMGFSATEIMWGINKDGKIVPERLLNRTQRRFQFDAVNRSLKIRNTEQPWIGVPTEDKKFIVHRVSAQWDNPFGDALLQSIYWMWLFKKTVTKFWMQNLETGASSIPIVKHPAGANQALKNEALSVAQMIRNGNYGRIPDNFEVIYAEAKQGLSNSEAYERFNRMCNDEISKCVNGQTLTVEASSSVGSGSRALGAVHQATQSQRDTFRAEGLSSTINRTLIRWMVDYNFQDVDGYPEFRLGSEDAEDMVKESTVVYNLAQAGYEIDAQELSDVFNYTIIDKATQPTDDVNPDISKEPKQFSEGKEIVKVLKEFVEETDNRLELLEAKTERDKKDAILQIKHSTDGISLGLERSKEEMNRIKDSLIEMADKSAKEERQEKTSILQMLARILDKDRIINVSAPRVRVAAPTVNVQAPNVSVEPATVEFKSGDINVNVPELKPPDVHVHVDKGAANKKLIVERDGQGYIKSIKGE